MRNRTEHGFSRLTAISDAGSTPAASTSLRPLPEGYGSACQIRCKSARDLNSGEGLSPNRTTNHGVTIPCDTAKRVSSAILRKPNSSIRLFR
jgi:hypothetical protein